MITAEAFASIDMALIFPFIFLRSRKHAGQIADRFGEIAARLALDGDDDREEVGFGDRNPLRHPLDGFRQSQPERLRFDDLAEFGFTGSGLSSAMMRRYRRAADRP